MDKANRFSEEEILHLKHCLADLYAIEEKARRSEMSWQDVRSVVLPLRRLLVDGGGELQKCWRLVSETQTPLRIESKELPEHVCCESILVSCGNIDNARHDQFERHGATISAPTDFPEAQVSHFQWVIDHETSNREYSVPALQTGLVEPRKC
jgi:hypothetical protein